MQFHLTVLGKDPLVEGYWAKKISEASQSILDVKITIASEHKAQKDYGQLLFVDANHPQLETVLGDLPRKGRAIFLILGESSTVPKVLPEGQVDDVLIFPFRSLELLSKFYRYQQILMWDEVQNLNASFSELLGRLQSDLQLAERLQKGRLEMQFPEVKGFKVSNRYLAGMKSGGDYFDIAESPGKNLISMVLTDSSSYGLSSSVLSVMMRVAVKLSSDETRSSLETVRRIHEELMLILGEKDQLSLFYGVVSRRDYKLRYVNLGGAGIFYAEPKAAFRALEGSGKGLTKTEGLCVSAELECPLNPEGRLVLLSDGFLESLGGGESTAQFLSQFRDQPSVNTLNELVFGIKKKFESEDDLPAQDCTAAIFDLDAKLLRLAT